ncbi:class I SAM-dependent methyltransferase [Candidatus Poribacteria bacterium]|nr:class I SAM-dependent methyltransferase [Candidatus Poribacteria bacterium]MBT5537035.1 class I SAM-dependent methyltransferase [Candidatus Poribacteria bacterium]MBT5712501.1 class I SAM-dependent methyltransferase [Candidatus Poribacteria bacterium]MBT7101689.1 class I SAM-dependent methyltransferase [Candidatus Poribacteria bacterium]MBT7809000.1 class I SAM-dependent methyltransferase [Candidatus Poribacteria bacterium]
MKKPKYTPDVFDIRNLAEAKSVILTPEEKTTTDERWERETPFVVGEIVRLMEPTADSVILDYGCGIGRIARELIRHSGCIVIGVDISVRMRSFARAYVRSERFVACSTSELDRMMQDGCRVDHAYTVWVLQHCADPSSDVARMACAVGAGGRLYVVNMHDRRVPTDVGWVDDEQDVNAVISNQFEPLWTAPLPEDVVSNELRDAAACSLWRRP